MDALTKSGVTSPQSTRPGRWRETLTTALPAGVLAATVSILGAAIHPLLPVLLVGFLAFTALALLRPLVALYLGLASMPLEAASLNLGALGITPSEGMLLVTAVAWLLKRGANREPILVRSSLTAPFAFGVAIMAMGFLVSETPLQVVKVLGIWMVFFVLIQMILAEGDARTVRHVMIAVAVSGAAFGAIAIANNGGQELREFGRTASGRVRGGFGSPNQLGEYLALAIPCQLALLLRGPRPLRLPMIAGLALAFVGLALTLSRGALLGIAGALLLLLAWDSFRRVFAVAAVLFVAASLIGFNPLGSVLRLELLVERVTSIRYEVKSNPRRVALQNSPDVIADHPLIGVGAGSLTSVAPEYGLTLLGEPLDNAHNMFLHIGAERGLLGLLAFIWLLAAFARSLIYACRKLSGENAAYAFAIAAAWLSLLLEGIADSVLQQNAVAATAFVLMACAVVLQREAERAPAATREEKRAGLPEGARQRPIGPPLETPVAEDRSPRKT